METVITIEHNGTLFAATVAETIDAMQSGSAFARNLARAMMLADPATLQAIVKSVQPLMRVYAAIAYSDRQAIRSQIIGGVAA